MYDELIHKINSLLESPHHDKQVVDKVNVIISKLGTSDQLGIHSDLSNASLQAVYKYRNELLFIDDAKEHIVWFYFRKMIENTAHAISDTILDEIIAEYKRANYIALESIIIDLIKKERLSQEQVDRIKVIFQSNAFRKQVICFKAKTLLENGMCLNREIVQELLAVKGYEVLELAIDNNALTNDTYVLFVCPIQGEDNRKAKQRFFDKIEFLKAQ
ncbi:hypothetical protein LOZ80_12260 [Paenibacillus sp. HWE-109]|uniref:hypothetical protein n=1 Tax=Paenibacillus sp. HWE-109 TaxID=1306526 RepID=UPI001EE04A62|nr:hypothetical protein [Paenibacillus sp. HWE-109]UKS29654.1 hypothetical protein LOZ80_12260 [Paenibacillus sp. HWE-109]